MIWEDLLTDEDGQYIEFQAGKLFNQAAEGSTYTPFKHKEFPPHDADIMHEIYFPLKETGGMVAASPEGVLNLEKEGNDTRIIFSALQPVNDIMMVKTGDDVIHEMKISIKPLEKIESVFSPGVRDFRIILKNGTLNYSSKPDDRDLERPLEPFENFDWESAYGYYTLAYELEKQRKYDEALENYLLAIERDPGLMPAITRIGLEFYRRMEYNNALEYTLKALRINTYDPEANYLYGLLNIKKNKPDEAKSGFSIAAASVSYRAAAFTELARIFAGEGNFSKSADYADKAIAFNNFNYAARQIRAVSLRKTENLQEAMAELEVLYGLDPVNHFVRAEKMFLTNSRDSEDQFTGAVTNELPYESFIDLAVFYNSINCKDEALRVLELSHPYPVRDIWMAWLDRENEGMYVDRIISSSPEFVLPFRNETAEILEDLIKKYDNWKLKYYLGLVYWNRNLDQKARELFLSCGDMPDYPPFYLNMAEMSTSNSEKREYLNRAFELEDGDWRAGLAMAKFYLENTEARQSITILEDLNKRYPEQSAIGLTYAKALMALGEYQKSIGFLESYNVLPFEGATIGRDLYHQACINLAGHYLDKKDFKKVIEYAQKALIWPANLGVGRPYDVDETLERSLIERANEGLKR
jgi:tetratricopeptide (TPR) repeat protein